jgi:methylaspartate ammonia-lyase
MRTRLPITETDRKRAKENPWGMTTCQCYAVRLVCEHGGSKRAAYAEDVELRAIEHHLMKARQQMGMFGNDIRMYINWDRWIRKQGEDDGR